VLPFVLFSQEKTDPAFNYIVEGNQLADAGYLEDAYSKFKEAIKVSPKNLIAYQNLAQVLFQLWNYQEAIKVFTKIIEMNPAHYGAYLDRGQCYAYLGQFDLAIKDWEKAVKMDPEAGVAQFYLCCVYKITGEKKLFEKLYNIMIQYIKSEAYFYDKIASFLGLSLHPQVFNVDKAIEYATTACQMTGWVDPDCLYTLAEAYFQKAYNRETGELNCFYIDKALGLMQRIFDLQGWLKIERNGYFIHRYKKMLKARETANCSY